MMSVKASTIPSPASATRPANLSGAVRTAFHILDAWQVSAAEAQAMLGLSRRTYFAWRKRAPANPDPDKLERISYILGIWKALQILLPDPTSHRSWPKRANDAPFFGGRPPLALMTAGHVVDLYRVRMWLDGWRG